MDNPQPHIHLGIGGWTYEPWRGAFYPEGLLQRRELEYASRKLTSIEAGVGWVERSEAQRLPR